MVVVTKIVPDRRQQNRIIVFLDGRRAGRLPPDVVERLGLAEGMDLNAAGVSALDMAVAVERAFDDGRKRLARQPYGRQALADRLAAAGHAQDAIEEACGRLEAAGMLDDRALGRAVISSLTARAPAGEPLLRMKLQQRGLDESLINELVAEVGEEDTDPLTAARAFARTKLPSLARLAPPAAQRRLVGLLARRGFDAEVIEAVVFELIPPDEG